MGFNDRDYARGMGRSGRPPLPVVTKWLLILNLGIFAIEFISRPEPIIPGLPSFGLMNLHGYFSVSTAFLGGQIWRLITFQFMHATLGHVAFNCVGIFIFGPFVERWWGTKRFIAYYLLTGVGGALFYTLLMLIGLIPNTDMTVPLVGASAGVFGLLFAVYRLNPDLRVRLLLPPVELTLRQLALGVGGLSVLIIIGGLVFPSAGMFGNSGGEAGHLGGAILGLILMKYPGLLRKGRRDDRKVVRPAQFKKPRKLRRSRGTKPKLRPRTVVDLDQESEVDRILEKVHSEGTGSLTQKELETLNEAARKKQ